MALEDIRKINAIFDGIGWKVRLQRKRTSYFVTLTKELVIGNALQKGDDLFYYLIDVSGRKAILLFLDGKDRSVNDRVL